MTCKNNLDIYKMTLTYLQTGRKLVARSEPPRLKRRQMDGDDQRTREEEELAYFFTM